MKRIEVQIWGLKYGAEVKALDECQILEVENIYNKPEENVINYSDIIRVVFGLALKFNIKQIVLDPWRCSSIIPALCEVGLEIKEVRPTRNEDNLMVDKEHQGILKRIEVLESIYPVLSDELAKSIRDKFKRVYTGPRRKGW